jgi:hypothetical protein
MKQLLITVILTFSFSALSECDYQELLNFDLGDFKELTPKNCIKAKTRADKKAIRTQEGICKCAKSNLDRLPYSPEDIDKKKLAKKSIEKAKIGLLSLSEEIFLLNNNKDLSNLELGPSCNSKNRLEQVSKCNNKKGMILNQNERKTLTKELYDQLLIDSQYKGPRQYPKESYPPALIDRKKLNSVNQCLTDTPVSQKLIADIQEKLLNSQIKSLMAIASDFSISHESVTNINSLIDHLQGSITNNEDQINLNKIRVNLKSNPLLNHISKSSSFLKDITQNKVPLRTLLSRYTMVETHRNEIKAGIEKKCDAVFKAFEASVCATNDESFIPSKTPSAAKNFLSKRYDTSKLADRMQVSSVLVQNYCGKDQDDTNFEIVTNLVNPILTNRLKEEDDFEFASEITYKETTLKMGKLLCDHLPPELTKLTNNEKYNSLGCADMKGLKPQECNIFEAAQAVLSSTYKTKVEQVKSLALTKAKELGITDEKEIAEYVEKAANNIDTNTIIKAHSDYNTPDTGNSNIVSSFLGEQPKAQVARAQMATKGKLRNSSGNSKSQTNDVIDLNDENTEEVGQAQQQSQMTYAQKAQARSNADTDQFYQNVMDRTVKHKKNRVARVKRAGKIETPSDTFNRVFESPYPESRASESSEEDSQDYFDQEAATVAYGMENDTNPTQNGALIPRSPTGDFGDTKSKEELAEESLKKALNSKHAANMASAASRAPASALSSLDTAIDVNDSTIELPEDAIEAVKLLLDGEITNSAQILAKLKGLLSKDEFLIQPKGQKFSIKIIKKNGKFIVDPKNVFTAESAPYIDKITRFLETQNLNSILAYKSSYEKFRSEI